MEAMPHEESSLTLPLIDDDNKERLRIKVESNTAHTSASTASVLKTCFNGLNALSGFV